MRSAITVMFNRPVVPLTSLADQASLPNPLALDPPASGQGEWLNTSIYIFRPDKPLAGGQTYTGRVAAGLQDTTGGLLKDDFVWHFGTQAPAVVSSIPAFNATDFAADGSHQHHVQSADGSCLDPGGLSICSPAAAGRISPGRLSGRTTT